MSESFPLHTIFDLGELPGFDELGADEQRAVRLAVEAAKGVWVNVDGQVKVDVVRTRENADLNQILGVLGHIDDLALVMKPDREHDGKFLITAVPEIAFETARQIKEANSAVNSQVGAEYAGRQGND